MYLGDYNLCRSNMYANNSTKTLRKNTENVRIVEDFLYNTKRDII